MPTRNVSLDVKAKTMITMIEIISSSASLTQFIQVKKDQSLLRFQEAIHLWQEDLFHRYQG